MFGSPHTYIGIRLNDEVDRLAKAITRNPILSTLEENTSLPFTDFKEAFKKEAQQQSKESNRRDGQKKGKEYFDFYTTNKMKPWYSAKKLPRKITVTINRCRSNHYNLAASLNRIGILDQAGCEGGYKSKDLNHVLWQCTLFETQRLELESKLRSVKYLPPYNIVPILAELNVKKLKFICDFFKQCDLNV